MSEDSNLETIRQIIAAARHIVVIQADNPDADSLGGSLALEHMLGDMGKQVSLYCAVDIPGYLHYLDGWDRVSSELPHQFDASIFVDVSTYTLLEKLRASSQMGWVATKPAIVFDHHGSVANRLDFARVMITDETNSSAGELLYNVARKLDWPLNPLAGANLMTAILGDTQGLSNDLATAATYRVMAELLELGVSRVDLEERRRELNKMPLQVYMYKARLIQRTEFSAGGRIATVDVPQSEINTYSPLYNPVPLIQNDMLGVKDVAVTIVFKHYDDNKVTGAIRCNNGYPIADTLAEKFQGGGHPYSSGFKVVSSRPYNEIKSECITLAIELLHNLDKESEDETTQHSHTQT